MGELNKNWHGRDVEGEVVFLPQWALLEVFSEKVDVQEGVVLEDALPAPEVGEDFVDLKVGAGLNLSNYGVEGKEEG